MYKINNDTFCKAEKLGLTIFPSDNSKYKLEVYDEDFVFL